VETQRLQVGCPVCGSQDVFYTCTPNCCFNHVCGNCGSTFEPVTQTTGRTLPGLAPPAVLPEASDPTVACAKCEATTVYQTAGGPLICTSCGSELRLELTEIAANNNSAIP
jgi:hypothetical protein